MKAQIIYTVPYSLRLIQADFQRKKKLSILQTSGFCA